MPRFVRDTVGPSSRGPRRTRTFDSSGPLSPIGVPAPMPGTWANAGAAYRLAIRATATAECLDVEQKRLCERGTRCGFTKSEAERSAWYQPAALDERTGVAPLSNV